MSNRHGTHSDYEYSALLRDDPDWDGKATSDSAEKHLTGAVSAKVLKRYSMAFAVTTFGVSDERMDGGWRCRDVQIVGGPCLDIDGGDGRI